LTVERLPSAFSIPDMDVRPEVVDGGSGQGRSDGNPQVWQRDVEE
jgi:hypothetical protein